MVNQCLDEKQPIVSIPFVFTSWHASLGETVVTRTKQIWQGGLKSLSSRLTVYVNTDMTVAHNRARNVFQRIYDAARPNGQSYYQGYVDQVRRLLENDRNARQREMQQPLLSDAPIARAFGPDDVDNSAARIWYDYNVNIERGPQNPQELLHIRAKADWVTTVTWRKPGEQAEITLADTPTRFFVAPLKPVSEAQQEDEIRPQDFVLLVGRYIIVAEPQHNDFQYPCIMTNWLEIQEAHAEEGRRRGRNFARKADHPVIRFV